MAVASQIPRNEACAIKRLDTNPDLLQLHALDPKRYPFLLESVVQGGQQSRFDILFAFPGDQILAGADTGTGFLDQLDEAWSRESSRACANQALPFHGGWFIYLGYELAAEIEPTLEFPRGDSELPDAVAVRIPAAVIFDHDSQESWLLAEPDSEDLLDVMAADVETVTHVPRFFESPALSSAIVEDPDQAYLDAVRKISEYIVEGDVFQVNLSRRWQGQLAGNVTHAGLYAALRKANPAPFSGLAEFANGQAIISSSPERLMSVADGIINTRPIAGTHPRGKTKQDDEALAHTLLGHPKERAEHLMLIDLERNDLGRVCEPGSIEVGELMTLETYAHVHHIVSDITGRLRADVSPADVIRALFPGGTITGCPKVRCMEIIAELEDCRRGPYTGAMGYINHDGSMDLNILIRSLVCEGDQISFRAGAGIVADSDPQRELAETRAKAQGLLAALGIDGAAP